MMWWKTISKRFLERCLAIARVDPDISYEQYNKMQAIYDNLYKDKK